MAEVAPGRLVPWLPVAFGFGIVVYFTADREPAWWAASAFALAGVAIVVTARHRAIGFPLTLGLAAIAAGFATATLQTVRIAHPVLQFPISSVTLSGFVEIREERERSDRIVIRVQHIEARRGAELPNRVRIAVRKNTAPLVAGLATTPYAAHHFHRLAPYGVLANLLAMPVVAAAVMPMGILGVLAMPFGFDAVFWQLMGYGLDWMIFVALWVTSLPGAVGRM